MIERATDTGAEAWGGVADTLAGSGLGTREPAADFPPGLFAPLPSDDPAFTLFSTAFVPFAPFSAVVRGGFGNVSVHFAAISTGDYASVASSVVAAGHPREGAKARPQTDPRAIFGGYSRLYTAKDGGHVAVHEGLHTSTVYRCSTLALGIAYCLVIYFCRNSAAELVKMLRGKLSTASLLEQAGHAFATFLTVVAAVSLLAGSIATVRAAEGLLPGAVAAALPRWTWLWAVPLLFAGLWAVSGYRFALLRIAGSLTLSREFTDRLWELRRMSTALGTLAVAPLVLLLALWDGPSTVPMLALLVAASALGQYRILVLFRGQKVSFLLWFLYLCTVELFPLSLAAAIMYRSVG